MADLNQRAKEIEQLHWREIQAIAQSFGFDTIDELAAHSFPGVEDLKWKDCAKVLAEMELGTPQPVEEAKPEPKPEPKAAKTGNKPVYATQFFKTVGIALGNDGDQRRTDRDGNPINF